MRRIRVSPEEIFREYENCTDYNNSIGLYSTVRQNENFYIGKQWEGLNAPDLDKPVLNFLKRVCSYIVAMLVSDDIGIEINSFDKATETVNAAKFLESEVKRVIERTKAKANARDMLRNCVVDGDGCFYWYFDADKGGHNEVKGEIALELIDNTRIFFGNPFERDVQKQPFVLITKREQVSAVRERARKNGQPTQSIRADYGSDYADERGYDANDLVTVIVKLYKKDGKVCFCETTRNAVIRPETRTEYSLYPVSYMNWERVKNSYHGQAVVTGLIPNQIAVNKLWAMAIRHQHTLAFPKVFYDRMKIKEWNNRVGEAVGVAGNPNDAVATSFRAEGMSNQLTEIVDKTISYTKEFMGASDAALGNVNPTNASAIIAVQKATAAPLELQRLSFYAFVEDYVRVIIEMICAHYGPRFSTYIDENGEEISGIIDFGKIKPDEIELNVEVGASAYWSELSQINSLDNLFAKGVISDALLYLESVPEGYIRNKNRIIKSLREKIEGEKKEMKKEKKGGENNEM